MSRIAAPVLIALCLASGPAASAQKALSQVRGEIEPFLQRYCADCHGADEQNGQVRFDQMDWSISDNDTAQRWQDILDQLNGGDMPPEDATQPTPDELSKVLDRLTNAILDARRRLTDHGGEITLRRLNKREYSNTIRHLFGFGVAADEIPDDGEIATFDTVGSEQFFTSSHFNKYLELGRRIALESFRFNLSRRRAVKTERTEPEERTTQKLRDKLADLDRKMALKKSGATWQEMGFKDEGEMQIIFSQWINRAEVPRSYLQYPLVDSGVYICDVAKWASTAMHTDIRGEYIIRIRGGVRNGAPALRRLIRVWGKHSIRGTALLSGTPEQPSTIEMTARQPLGRSHLSVTVRENVPENTINSMRGYVNKVEGPGERTDPRAAVWIDWIEIEGPYYPETRPAWEDMLYPDSETGGKSAYIWNDSRIGELLERFAFEAFRRRMPSPEYVDALTSVYQQHRADGMNQRDAMVEAMAIVLASPGFLFHHEHDQPSSADHAQADNTIDVDNAPGADNHQYNPRTLSSRELAIRLAYFLWSSPPDDELYAANLLDEDELTAQVDRMLADERVASFQNAFISQWAELDRYDAITVDNREHFWFNEGVQQDAKQEVREFFRTLMEENLPVANLIDSPFVTINATLATHYGIDAGGEFSRPGGATGFRKVPLAKSSPRGGLMTQTAFLTTGSNGERSSPVIRGALVMEKLLHDKPAPPPPNVPELGAASDEPKSNREMVRLHQQQAVCASCHRKMDVIGFGLENFDTIGRWRDTEKVGRKQVAIDPSGTLPDGSSFESVQQLKSLLLSQQEALARELTESMLAYALGRTIEFSDGDDVDAILSQLRPNGFRTRDMIRAVALSTLLRRR